MSCDQQTIRVFNGNGNTAEVVFGYVDDAGDPQLWDFSAVTRYVLTLESDPDIVLDTDVTAGLITDAGSGELVFDLGAEAIPVGLYVGTLRIYTAAYPTGYLMDTGDGTTLLVDVR